MLKFLFRDSIWLVFALFRFGGERSGANKKDWPRAHSWGLIDSRGEPSPSKNLIALIEGCADYAKAFKIMAQ